MGLFGKHTKSAELGSMVKSLATFAGGALLDKGDPSTQSGGLTSGGLTEGGGISEEGAAGGGPTFMHRLGTGFKAMQSGNLMDFYQEQGKADQSSAMAKLANERAAGLQQEREAKETPWDFLGAANKIDASGGLGKSLEQFFNMSGANKDGGVMTLMEVDDANKNVPGFNEEISNRIMKHAITPLTTMITNSTQQIEQMMLKGGQLSANGKVDISMLDHPDIAAQLPKAAEAYKTLKNQQETLKLATGVHNDFVTRQKYISPPSAASQEANAMESQVADMMREHPEISRQQAYSILGPKSRRTLENAWIDSLGHETMPMSLEHWKDIKPQAWTQVAEKISKDGGMEGVTLRDVWKEMLETTYSKDYGGYGGSGNRAGNQQEIQTLVNQLNATATAKQDADAMLNEEMSK